jgi:hypothetical protein
MDVNRVRQVSWVSYQEYAQAFLSAWRIYRFYRACGCSIRVAVSRAKLGRDPYQWLVEEQEKVLRGELRAQAQAELAGPPPDIRQRPRRTAR